MTEEYDEAWVPEAGHCHDACLPSRAEREADVSGQAELVRAAEQQLANAESNVEAVKQSVGTAWSIMVVSAYVGLVEAKQAGGLATAE